MRVLGNIIWFLLLGFQFAVCYFLLGLILCFSIVGIPYGIKCFKLSRLVLFPFGKTVDTNFDSHPWANIFWNVLIGSGPVSTFAVLGALLCVTIIGIPFGKQCFKIVKYSFLPFGAVIYK